jgi:hypothetical protein
MLIDHKQIDKDQLLLPVRFYYEQLLQVLVLMHLQLLENQYNQFYLFLKCLKKRNIFFKNKI